MAEVTLSDANFATEVEQSSTPVLVDFWAPWCGPCKVIGPIIEQLAKDYEGKAIKITKLNVDENQQTAQKYGIMSIPSLLFFKDGQVVEQLMGVQAEETLREKLDALIA